MIVEGLLQGLLEVHSQGPRGKLPKEQEVQSSRRKVRGWSRGLVTYME